MRLTTIQPFQTWYDGTTVIVNEFGLKINSDNLTSEAEFMYALISNGSAVFTAYLIMSGSDYQAWSGTNEEAVAWTANALNLIII